MKFQLTADRHGGPKHAYPLWPIIHCAWLDSVSFCLNNPSLSIVHDSLELRLSINQCWPSIGFRRENFKSITTDSSLEIEDLFERLHYNKRSFAPFPTIIAQKKWIDQRGDQFSQSILPLLWTKVYSKKKKASFLLEQIFFVHCISIFESDSIMYSKAIMEAYIYKLADPHSYKKERKRG